tara:strand:+ start:430 stop:708 length:279 start_codon:yes stop_codon:yes gene_type:complete
MTPEQMNEITKLGYMVLDKGNSVMDMSTKEMVLTVDAEGNYVTEVEAIQNILGTVEKVRARNKKGHYIKDDPTTPENEAWTTKIVKKVKGKK